MSLVPREQETLAAIENRLRATDPRFAAMFRLLDTLGPRSQGTAWVFGSVWLARHGTVAAIGLLTSAIMVLTGSVVAGLILA